jgi:putative ABC transport system permease protein
MGTLIQDFRFAIRQLRRSPGFAIIAVFTIALGIGVTTAMFSVVNAVLLRPLPFPHPERLVAIGEYDTRHGVPRNELGSVSYPDLEDIRNRNRSFADVALYNWNEATLTGLGEPLHVNFSQVNASIFSILGVQPALGRAFTTDEDQPGHYVAIVSDHFWRTHLNRSANAIGRTVDLNGRSFSVVGVMPAGFQFPVAAEGRDLWVTVSRVHETDGPGDTPTSAERGNHSFGAVGRLKEGVTLQQANADLKSIGTSLSGEFPNTNSHSGMAAVSELDSLVGDIRTPLLVLLAAVGLVLLIACSNVANLLLVRGSERLREIGVRTALGASRLRVVRQLLTESLMLSLIGTAVGVVLASFMLSGVLRLYPQNLPRADAIGLDWRVLLFSAGLAIFTGIFFGLMPSLHVASPDVATNIRSGTSRTATAGRGQNRLRSGLVVAETAIGVILLIGAGLLLRSLHRLTKVDLGFDPTRLLTASFDLSETKYNSDQEDRFIHDLLARLNSLPGIVAASGGLPLPLSEDHFSVSFNLLDHPLPEANQPSAGFYVVSPGFFESLRMPLIRGRFFDEHDQRNLPPTMVISQSFAQKYFPNEDPIGKRIEIGAGEGAARKKYKTREVVGVVGDLRTSKLEKQPAATYYVPLPQLMWSAPTLVIRTAGQPYGVVEDVTKTLRSMDPAAPLYNVRSMEDYLALDLGRARFQTVLLGLFAGIALLLTAVGLYGVMAQSVAQRTQEIGIRLAMGATRENVRSMIIRRGTVLSLAGTALGIIGALAFARVIESLLYEIPPRDPMTYVMVCVVLAFVALLASYVPALRATRLDPMIALRYE